MGKKKSNLVGISKLTGEVFIGGKAKVKFFIKNRWGESREKVMIVTAAQARLLIAEDNNENYPKKEGW